MSAEERNAPFAAQVAAVAHWLDGTGAEFLQRVGSRTGAAHTWEFQLQHPALRGRTRVKLVLPRGFPARAPRIVLDNSLCLVLPHVEESGVVCLGKLSESKGYAAPDQAVQDVLAAFDTFLDKCTDIAWVVAEFEREALAYWNRFCQFSAKQKMRWRVRQLLNAVGRVDSLVEGRVAVYEAGRVAIASGPGIDPNFLARRHRLSRGTLEFARAVFVPLPASTCWTPSSWPRSFEELAALLHEATAGSFDLLAWCSSDPKGPPAGFVILAAANAVYAYQLTPAIVPKLTSPGIVPLGVTRIDPDWALVRDQRLDRANRLLKYPRRESSLRERETLNQRIEHH